jgi:DNA mismatch repair protein MutL
MQKIQVLSDALASQVAAGEVVERPASVVKELVENSVDSGARRIDVLVRSGGTALIKVVDDGCGMGREDAVLCLERHATSKLRTSADLAAIMTMGFRGEALPSIASVSRFTLTTRETGALSGTQVSVDGGRLLGVSDAGEAPGTHIEVRNLFYNIPARRKFLRAENTEFSHIEQHVRVQALAHPEIAFSLTRDERLVFHLPGNAGLHERIAGLAGAEVAGQLLEVPRQTMRGVTASGFIGKPGVHRSTRGMQFTFLNRRPVESPVFNYALRGAYAEALPRGQWPVAFLFIELDPREVDVNVHPAKREVRFRDGNGVQSALMEMLSTVLRGRPAETPAPAEPGPVPVVQWRPAPRQEVLLPRAEPPPAKDADTPCEHPAPHPSLTTNLSAPAVPPPPSADDRLTRTGHPAPPRPAAPLPFTLLAPLTPSYWLLQSGEGLVILDPRAAQERILFEDARRRVKAGGVVSQQLLSPVAVPLSPREFDLIRPHLATLRLMGIGAEEFGANTIIIDSLPPGSTADGDAPGLISALIADLQTAGDRAPQRRLDDDAIAAAVARQAARLQAPDDAAAVTTLVRRLLACDMPYCCPEGKPTLIQFSFQELARKFGKR